MSFSKDAPEGPATPRSPERTQEIIAALNVAATELISRIVKAERDVHDQRNASFHAMNRVALLSDDVARLRSVLGTVRQLIEAAQEHCPTALRRDDLRRGLVLIDDALVETSEQRDR